jgi:hypothetical protein
MKTAKRERMNIVNVNSAAAVCFVRQIKTCVENEKNFNLANESNSHTPANVHNVHTFTAKKRPISGLFDGKRAEKAAGAPRKRELYEGMLTCTREIKNLPRRKRRGHSPAATAA